MKTQEKISIVMVGALAALTLVCAPNFAHGMPGDMLDQALHQSMREHSSAQQELAASGTTRVEDKNASPSVEADGIRIVVGQGEILADSSGDVSAELGRRTNHKIDNPGNSQRAAQLKATHALLGTAEPTRMDASAQRSEDEGRENLTADQELLDPVP